MNATHRTALRLTGEYPAALVLLAALSAAALMWWLYRRERSAAPVHWLPAACRSLAVFLLVLAFSAPVLRHETLTRRLNRVIVALDTSASMRLEDPAAGKPEGQPSPTRMERAQRLLLQPQTGLLSQLQQTHDVELNLLRGNSMTRLWWHRQEGRDRSGPLPTLGEIQADAPVTNLDEPLREALGDRSLSSTVVLISDGQHNGTGSPQQLATALRESAIPVFTLGLGSEVPPADLSLLEVQTPEAVFNQERLSGSVLVQDSMPAGTPARIEIKSSGKLLWSEDFAADGRGEKRIDFSLPVAELPGPPANQSDKTLRILEVEIQARGDRPGAERTRANNHQQISLHVLERKRRVLIIDSRPRWEVRYLHNHFERDERWQATLLIDDQNAEASGSQIQRNFPASRQSLLDHDLIILGDVGLQRLGSRNAALIAEFVTKRGGGLILLDGNRGQLDSWANSSHASLIPITRRPTALPSAPRRWSLSALGLQQRALSLSDSTSANAGLWSSLPESLWNAAVDAKPGAQVLAHVQAANEKTPTPSMVFSQVGAGAVLYLGSDEWWRWRFQVADLHHQRLWMQLAGWIAAPPFQVEQDQVCIGTDRLRYKLGQQAELRVRLRDAKGELKGDGQPVAHLMENGREVATLQMEPDPTHFGVYRAQTPPLKVGHYQVAVAPSAASPKSNATLSLHVADAGNPEWANLTMNRSLLEAMALQSGGRFLREEQAGELPALLQALDRREIEVRETILWSSWWWFLPVIALLSLEWILRKRLRLL